MATSTIGYEIGHPGGFVLKFLSKLTTRRSFLDIKILEEAFVKLEEMEDGIITYDIIDREPQELPEDLTNFTRIGLIKLHQKKPKIKLTEKGLEWAAKSTLPAKVIIPFEKVVQDIMSQN